MSAPAQASLATTELMILSLKLERLRRAATAVVDCVGYALRTQQAIDRLRAEVVATGLEEP